LVAGEASGKFLGVGKDARLEALPSVEDRRFDLVHAPIVRYMLVTASENPGGVAESEGAQAKLIPQAAGGFHFILQLLIDLIDRDLGGRAWSEAAVGG
jgi:hypothetical protein